MNGWMDAWMVRAITDHRSSHPTLSCRASSAVSLYHAHNSHPPMAHCGCWVSQSHCAVAVGAVDETVMRSMLKMY